MFAMLDKAFKITMLVAFGCLGVVAALVVFRVALEVTVVLLGSGVGTVIFLLIFWMLYKAFKKSES